MKKLIALLLLTVAVFSAMFACGETPEFKLKDTDRYVVLTPSNEFVGQSVLTFMSHEKENGRLIYTADSSGTYTMITSINGIKNPSDYSYCWMIYTDDENNYNEAYGSVELEGKKYYQAVYGAENLIIAQGKIYIWFYQSFAS